MRCPSALILVVFASTCWLLASSLSAEDVDQPLVEIPAAENVPAAPAVENLEEKLPEGVRWKLYQQTMIDWVTEVCSLSEIQRQQLAEQSADFEESIIAKAVGTHGLEATPLFAGNISLVALIRQSLLDHIRQQILTDDQLPRLETALRERTVFQRRAFRDVQIGDLDSVVGFTSQQRSELQSVWPLTSIDLDLSDYYVRQFEGHHRTGRSIPASFIEKLTADQQAYLRTWQLSEPQALPIEFLDGEVVPASLEQVKTVVDQGRQATMRSAELQIAIYNADDRVTPQQVEALRLAGKRIAMEASEQWRAKVTQISDRERAKHEQKMTQVHQDGLGPRFDEESLTRMEVLSRSPIWQEALNSIPQETRARILAERNKFRSDARTANVVAMLDQELWLRPGQREAMREIVSKSIPAALELSEEDTESEMLYCAFPLLLNPGEAAPGFLNEQQQRCWEVLKKQYDGSVKDKLLKLASEAREGIPQPQIKERIVIDAAME